MKVTSKFLWCCLALAATLLSNVSCTSPPLADMGPLDGVQWVTYSNPIVGYSFSYPGVLDLTERGGEVMLSYRGKVGIRVVIVSEDEGKARGLWVGGKPLEKTTLGSRDALRYEYDHFDFGVTSHTVAYVAAHRGKELGLEFRLAPALADVERRVVASFRFAD